MSILIKPAHTMEEVALCRRLAAQVWGEPSACSIPQMSVHAKYGGVLLLAFDDETPVGFLFSFPALYHGECVLWSHETAVLPGYLHQGIGAKLKMTQRQRAREIGYDKIAWTFDPLVSRNAYFNLNKLGARVSEYKINAYGMDDTDNINRGMETDRFIAVWDLKDDTETGSSGIQLGAKVGAKREIPVAFSNGTQVTSGGVYRWLALSENMGPVLSSHGIGFGVADTAFPSDFSIPADTALLENQTGGSITIETAVPLDFESMVGKDRTLAIAWRLAFRESALELMRGGFRPSHLVIDGSGGSGGSGAPGHLRSYGSSQNSNNALKSGPSFAKYIWTRAGDQK